MTRDRAIEVMDRLVGAGYGVSLSAQNMGDFMVPGADPEQPNVRYAVHLQELHIDSIDVRALADIADELGVDCGFSPVRGGTFSFGEDERPHRSHADRRHPKGA